MQSKMYAMPILIYASQSYDNLPQIKILQQKNNFEKVYF